MLHKAIDKLCIKLTSGRLSEREFQKAYCKIKEMEDKTEFLWREDK